MGRCLLLREMVEAMLNLVRDETGRIDSRFPEPACGSANFISGSLKFYDVVPSASAVPRGGASTRFRIAPEMADSSFSGSRNSRIPQENCVAHGKHGRSYSFADDLLVGKFSDPPLSLL